MATLWAHLHAWMFKKDDKNYGNVTKISRYNCTFLEVLKVLKVYYNDEQDIDYFNFN